MPYIRPKDRPQLDELIEPLAKLGLTSGYQSGDMNYTLTRLIFKWWLDCPSYSRGAEIMGLLSCVAAEFYRRVLAPYENAKLAENGDVYD